MLIGHCGMSRAHAGTASPCGILADDSVGLYGLLAGSDRRAAEKCERLGAQALQGTLDLEVATRSLKRAFTIAHMTRDRLDVVYRGDLELWRVRDGRLLRVAQPQSLEGRSAAVDVRSVDLAADDHLLFCTPEVLSRGKRERSPNLGDLLDGVLGRGCRAAAADLLELALARGVVGCLAALVVEVGAPS